MFFCNGVGHSLYQVSNASPGDIGFRLNLEDEYDRDCSRCEILVVLSRSTHDMVLDVISLVPTRGMILTTDIASVGLARWDRLEPSATLPDICEFKNINKFPFPCTFWRTSQESSTRHRNPLIDPSLGISVGKTFTVDLLHAQYLGSVKALAKHLVWHLLLSGV